MWFITNEVGGGLCECKCDTNQKICTPPDGDINCRNCGVYYKLEQGDSFQCMKRCPDGYYGSQSLSLCVPCSNITEHCSGYSNYDSTPHCDYCDYPYTLKESNNVCGRGGSGDNTSVIVKIVLFSVLAVVYRLQETDNEDLESYRPPEVHRRSRASYINRLQTTDNEDLESYRPPEVYMQCHASYRFNSESARENASTEYSDQCQVSEIA
ncbi:hypothetical protein LSAT2_030091 [Lamellibrachia satsuma]|nr:hypothetical protein LSAT2_030091 [Lamellibrachia satsuma]